MLGPPGNKLHLARSTLFSKTRCVVRAGHFKNNPLAQRQARPRAYKLVVVKLSHDEISAKSRLKVQGSGSPRGLAKWSGAGVLKFEVADLADLSVTTNR